MSHENQPYDIYKQYILSKTPAENSLPWTEHILDVCEYTCTTSDSPDAQADTIIGLP